jgi:hypothetical protein
LQPSCQYLDIVISIFVIINLVPIFDLIYFARAIGRLTKPPFTTLLPLSCITLANKEAIFPPPASSGERPTNAAKVPNITLTTSDSKFSLHLPRYTEEQFLEVSAKVLSKLKIVHVVGKAVWDQRGDIRDVISIGKLVRKSDGPVEVESILSTMNTYGETKEH